MSKVEERGKTYALHKASEKLNDYYGNAMLSVVQFDGHDIQRAFTEGYHQAEKDNELTWEDIETIGELRLNVALELRRKELESSIKSPLKFTTEDMCKEVLKRFKDLKKINLTI